MKYRLGFVSNSSSTSFTCEVCDEVQSGWDMGLDEAGMVECEAGHVFCEEHIPAQIKAQLEDYTEEEEGRLKSKACPLCTLKFLSTYNELAYYRKKLNTNNAKTLEEIKKEFLTYEAFSEYTYGSHD